MGKAIKHLDQLRQALLELDALDQKIAELEAEAERLRGKAQLYAAQAERSSEALRALGVLDQIAKPEPRRVARAPKASKAAKKDAPTPGTQIARVIAAVYELGACTQAEVAELLKPKKLRSGTLNDAAKLYPDLITKKKRGLYTPARDRLPESLAAVELPSAEEGDQPEQAAQDEEQPSHLPQVGQQPH